jgi:hypothetical protein
MPLREANVYDEGPGTGDGPNEYTGGFVGRAGDPSLRPVRPALTGPAAIKGVRYYHGTGTTLLLPAALALADYEWFVPEVVDFRAIQLSLPDGMDDYAAYVDLQYQLNFSGSTNQIAGGLFLGFSLPRIPGPPPSQWPVDAGAWSSTPSENWRYQLTAGDRAKSLVSAELLLTFTDSEGDVLYGCEYMTAPPPWGFHLIRSGGLEDVPL